MTTATPTETANDAHLALDFGTICAVSAGGTRTPEYDRTLMALCEVLATAIALDDEYGQRDVKRLIHTLTERANYQEWVR